jgi:hypothetical protein
MRTNAYLAAIIAVVEIVGLQTWATTKQLDQKPAGARGEIVGRVIDSEGRECSNWSTRSADHRTDGQRCERPTDSGCDYHLQPS